MRKRRIEIVAGAIVAVVLLAVVLVNTYQVFAGVMWLGHCAVAKDTSSSEILPKGATYLEATAILGHPDYEAPGFEIDGRMQACVAVWEAEDGRETRALVWRDRVVAARDGEWRLP